jgi:hypothetical protein
LLDFPLTSLLHSAVFLRNLDYHWLLGIISYYSQHNNKPAAPTRRVPEHSTARSLPFQIGHLCISTLNISPPYIDS